MSKQVAKEKERPIGFFREDGVTKPIMPRKGKQTVTIRKVSKETFEGGKVANLKLSMETDDGVIDIDTDIRWETQKVEKLVQTEYRTTEGVLCFKKYVGGTPGKLSFVDVDGKIRKDDEVLLVQVLPDGSRKEIDPFTQSKAIKAEARNKEMMNSFLPESYLEIWADNTEGQRQLRKLAWYMIKSGKVAAVREFAKAKGAKAYVGFIYPVLGPDGKTFGLEMMCSENRRERKRWMPSEPAEVVEPEKEKKEVKAEVPDLFKEEPEG